MYKDYFGYGIYHSQVGAAILLMHLSMTASFRLFWADYDGIYASDFQGSHIEFYSASELHTIMDVTFHNVRVASSTCHNNYNSILYRES